MTVISINAGELMVGGHTYVLEAPGLGSCVAVCLYDAKRKNGGMAHIMLPADNLKTGISKMLLIRDEGCRNHPLRYADIAIDKMIEELKSLGSFPDDLVAKIFGGSEMFVTLVSGRLSMGRKNIESVREKLAELSIPIISEDVGGNVGRSVKFFVDSGDVEIRKRM
ncbi:MAG: chemotaxis protein CheD [Parcubacteria group bacterium]|jgi:chemotaxis protein CheD